MAASIGRILARNSLQCFVKRRAFWSVGHRYLLTNEYKCHEIWKQRLQSPLLQKIDIDTFILKVQEKMDKEGSASAIDLDIVANKLETVDPLQLDFVQNLFYRFRHSKDAVNARDSMSHALIRNLLEHAETDRIMNMLRDKINYGVFLDNFTANILLDYFIEHQQYKDAAEVACDLMLQEDLSHPLCRVLSWLACHHRVSELLSTENVASDSATQVANDDDDQEIVYRRVSFIENPWYDDHFDIPTERQRIGKTLSVVTTPGDNVLSRGYLLLGWALYEKLDKVLALMQQWIDEPTVSAATVSVAQLDQVCTVIATISTREPATPKEHGLLTLSDLYPYVTQEQKSQCLTQFNELAERLKSVGKVLTDESLDCGTRLLKHAMDTLSAVGPTDIQQLEQTYQHWIDSRQNSLNEQLEQHQLAQRKRQIAIRLLELRQREEKLRYFEEQSRIELKIAELPSDWDRPVTGDVSEEQFVAPPGERKGDAGKRTR